MLLSLKGTVKGAVCRSFICDDPATIAGCTAVVVVGSSVIIPFTIMSGDVGGSLCSGLLCSEVLSSVGCASRVRALGRESSSFGSDGISDVDGTSDADLGPCSFDGESFGLPHVGQQKQMENMVKLSE